jgi:hypothetical protein
MLRRVLQKAAAVFSGPFAGTAILLLGILAGLLGSIYPAELQGFVQTATHLTPTAGAAAFLLLVPLTAALAFVRQWVVDQKREEVQRRFDAAARDIPELIRTLPDLEFIDHLGTVLRKHLVLLRALDDLQSRAQGMSTVLSAIAELASKYDRGVGGRYAANLMVFVENSDSRPWRPLVKFFDGDPEQLGGLLVLPRDFTADSDGCEDKCLREFALPVPREAGVKRSAGGDGYRVMPGAPMAYLLRNLEHFKNAAELADFCEKECDFTRLVRSQIKEYFATHASDISGLFSYPVFGRLKVKNGSPHDATRTGEESVLGILNVHWSRPGGRLARPEAAQLFIKATLPLQVIISHLLVDLLEERPPVPVANGAGHQ